MSRNPALNAKLEKEAYEAEEIQKDYAALADVVKKLTDGETLSDDFINLLETDKRYAQALAAFALVEFGEGEHTTKSYEDAYYFLREEEFKSINFIDMAKKFVETHGTIKKKIAAIYAELEKY